jgi:hypothetical protein
LQDGAASSVDAEATIGNDRSATFYDRDATICDVSLLESRQRGPLANDSLDQALGQLRLEGAIFLRAEYTEGWALAGQGGPAIAGMLHPGAERVIFMSSQPAVAGCLLSTVTGTGRVRER